MADTHSSPPQGIYTVSGNLREEAAAKAELEKSNFDLKMRVFYLEEKLTRLAGGESSASIFNSNSDSDAAVNGLKLQVEEKNLELEQRNVLLTKAKTAIEALKKEIERNKADSQRQQDLEDRVRRLKLASDEMDSEYKAQIVQIESQLTICRQQQQAKDLLSDQKVSELETKNQQMALSVQQITERLHDCTLHKDRAEESSLQARQRAEELEEELLQLRAHIDLFRLQGHETNQEFDNMKLQIQEMAAKRAALEQEHKHRIEELHSHHKIELVHSKQAHQQELDRALQEARDEARNDADHLRSQYDAQLREARAHEQKEVAHERAQLNLRIDDLVRRADEKQAEVKSLNDEMKAMRAHHDGDRSKAEQAVREMELSKLDANMQREAVDKLKHQLQDAQEELKRLRISQESGAEAKEGLRRELIERNQLAQKLEQAETSIEKLRQIGHEKEIKILHDEAELRRLQEALDDHRTRLANHEGLVRDHERLKADCQVLKADALEANNREAHTSRDLSTARTELEQYRRTLHQMEEEMKHLESTNESLIAQKEELRSTMHHDRSNHSTAEALLKEQHATLEAKLVEQKLQHDHMLKEHKMQMEAFIDNNKDQSESHIGESRALIASLRLEVEHLNKEKLEHEKQLGTLHKENVLLEKELGDTRDKSAQLREDIIKVFKAVCRSLSQWDESLQTILEGNVHSLGSFNPSATGMLSRGVGKASFFESGVAAPRHRKEEDVDLHVFVHHNDAFVARIDDLMQDVAITTDRVQVKMDRAARLRAVFDLQSQRMFESMQVTLESVSNRSALLHHRTADAATKTDALRHVLERDARNRLKDDEELKRFRAEMLTEHALRVQQASEAQAQLAALQIKFDASEENCSALSQQVEELRQELAAYAQAETVVAELSRRVADLGEHNHILARQVEQHEQSLEERTQRVEELLLERASLEGQVDRLANIVEQRDAALQASNNSCASLLAEVDRLEQRQMPHSLAAVILETQQMLQGSNTGAGASSLPSPSHAALNINTSSNNANTSAATNAQGQGSPTESIGKLTRAALELESWGQGQGQGQGQHNSNVTGASKNREAGQVPSLGMGGRTNVANLPRPTARAQVQQSSSSGSSNSSSSSSGGGNNIAPSRHVNFNIAPPQSPGSPQEQSAGLMFRLATPGPGVMRQQQQFQLPYQHQYQQQYHQSLTSPGPRSALSSPSAYASTPHGSQHLHGYPSSGNPAFSSSFTAASASANMTPNTYARASVSRLGKLGSDLEALARKLDQFDSVKGRS